MTRFLRSRRSFELVQLLLALASVTAVMDASRAAVEQDLRASAAYVRSSGDPERSADRRLNDLARFERKRREAAQRASCRAPVPATEARCRAPAPTAPRGNP
jgi:hypothetical protein